MIYFKCLIIGKILRTIRKTRAAQGLFLLNCKHRSTCFWHTVESPKLISNNYIYILILLNKLLPDNNENSSPGELFL